MELSLSLGESATTPFSFLREATKLHRNDLGFCIALGGGACLTVTGKAPEKDIDISMDGLEGRKYGTKASSDPPVQLDLLHSSPVPRVQHPSSQLRIPWLTGTLAGERLSSNEQTRAFDVNRSAAHTEDADDGAALSSPNSEMSSLQMEFCMKTRSWGGGKGDRDPEVDEAERGSSRGLSDDDENGSTRKKLRLSKEQSAYLEESFKEHTTLNPKQKAALAKQLNLRPRQVEVWFQNRRARTKLKQTEVDCEYLKRCCETLTEENRRLQKELQELRALKSSRPFYMQLPATTLTMCPSCERVATNSSSSSNPAYSTRNTSSNTMNRTPIAVDLSLNKPKMQPLNHESSDIQQPSQPHQTDS